MRCPAVRQAATLGVTICVPITVDFEGARGFLVGRYLTPDGRREIAPGVIGDPDSLRLYARIDSGFSIIDSHTALLQVPAISLAERDEGLIVPIVVYPSDYRGPILIAMSSTAPARVEVGEDAVQLIPLTEHEVVFEIIDQDVEHPTFSGLFSKDWPASWTLISTCPAQDLWQPFDGAPTS